MADTPSLRVALYARASSPQQSAGGTSASQVEALRQRIGRDGLRRGDGDCYLDDGYSGEGLVRPALERLGDRAAAGALDRLYVLHPDRLARSFAGQVLLLDEFARAGLEVVSLNRACGDSPEDRLLLQVQGIIAEFERTRILERGRRGREYAARQGRVSVPGHAPYGYRYVDKHQGGGLARYEVVPEQAGVVRRIFARAAQQRCSLREVCRRLEGQGAPSPGGRPRWSAKTVATPLGNPAYQGKAAVGKTRLGQRRPRRRPGPGRGQAEQPRRPRSIDRTPEAGIAIPVPAPVDEAVFAAAAEQLQENRRRPRQRQPSGRYLLAGLTVCKQCG